LKFTLVALICVFLSSLCSNQWSFKVLAQKVLEKYKKRCHFFIFNVSSREMSHFSLSRTEKSLRAIPLKHFSFRRTLLAFDAICRWRDKNISLLMLDADLSLGFRKVRLNKSTHLDEALGSLKNA
jgi:hypothetical protein